MTNIASLGIILGLSIFIIALSIIFFVTLKSKSSENTTEDEEKKKVILSVITVLTIVVAGILITMVSIEGFTDAEYLDKNHDVSNWITLTVEIGVGVVIAIIILIYSQSKNKITSQKFSNQIQQLGGTSEDSIMDVFEGTIGDTMKYQTNTAIGTFQERHHDEN